VHKSAVSGSDDTQELIDPNEPEENVDLTELTKRGERDIRIKELINKMDEEMLKRYHQVSNIMEGYARSYIPTNVFDGYFMIIHANESSNYNDNLDVLYNEETLNRWCSTEIIQRYAPGNHITILTDQGAEEVSRHIDSFVNKVFC
jgi:hypothetical protein